MDTVVVEVVLPVVMAQGGLHNPGERAAFPADVAQDLIDRGVVRAVKRVVAPPVDKRLTSPPSSKSMKAR